MTGQNDRQDESLTGQVRDQAGHCPLTGRYFQPCYTLHVYSCFEKRRKKWTRQSWKVLWVVLSALFSNEIWKNGMSGHGRMLTSANEKQQK